jgi:hypothetical protein
MIILFPVRDIHQVAIGMLIIAANTTSDGGSLTESPKGYVETIEVRVPRPKPGVRSA